MRSLIVCGCESDSPLTNSCSDGMNQQELFAGFRLKVEKMLSPTLIVSHAIEMGGHHSKEASMGPMGE
jgi:hypothetical protein